MSMLRMLYARMVGLFSTLGGRDTDDELREELEAHIEMHVAENIRRGMTPEAARRDALAAAGRSTAAVEAVRAQRGIPFIENIIADLRYALRTLRRKPGFTTAVIGTLALGIGANAAVFTIVNAVVLRPLAYPHSERIMSISMEEKGVDRSVLDDKTFTEWGKSSTSIEAIGAYGYTTAVVTGANGPDEVRGARATAGYFTVFGVAPAQGRVFTAEEDRPGGPPVVVLSDQLWHSAFNADPSILGKPIQLDGAPTIVVGVMPASFTTTKRYLFWTPYRLRVSNNATWFYSVIARLKPGATLARVRTELSTVMHRIAAQISPASLGFSPKGHTPVVMTLHDRRYGDSRTPLVLLFSAVGVLLLMACANLANLSLARAASRQREFAVRLALGAGRWRLVRYVLCESLLLSAAGAALGLLIAKTAVGYFVNVSPGSVGNAENVHVDAGVLVFALTVAALTGVLVGILPALAATRGDLNHALASGSVRNAGSVRQQFIRRALVIAQLATALVLLTGAGLVTQTFWRSATIDPGFTPDHLLVADVRRPQARYSEAAAAAFFDALLTRIRAEPGVRSAALGRNPLGGASMTITTKKDGPKIDIVDAGPLYFETIGAPLVAGRAIDSTDRAGTPPVAVVNAMLARLLFPGQNPIGQTLPTEERHRIVGVVGDVRHWQFETPASPVAYVALAQDGVGFQCQVLVRTTGPADALIAPIRRAVQSIDPAQPAPNTWTMESVISESIAPRRFTFMLLGVFAVLAASIAAIGLYGVLAYLVAERTREIGIRVALGADSGRLLRLVLGQGMALAAIGVVIGLVASSATVRLLRNFVYGMSLYDLRTFAVGAVLLAVVALLASYVPARRASRVDPMTALRAE